jgi:hypothetical protein
MYAQPAEKADKLGRLLHGPYAVGPGLFSGFIPIQEKRNNELDKIKYQESNQKSGQQQKNKVQQGEQKRAPREKGGGYGIRGGGAHREKTKSNDQPHFYSSFGYLV